MFRHLSRSLSTTYRRAGVWTDLSSGTKPVNNPFANPAAVEQKNPGYRSPLHINDTFAQAYQLLEQESEAFYNKAQKTRDPKAKHDLLVKAEQFNPEVLYNVTYGQLDLTKPVYRQHALEAWKSHDLMVLMQRLEQLHVIPDTLPTLDPKVDVRVKFPHNANGEFNDWIVPGTIVPTFSVALPPTVQIQKFEDTTDLYTILVVNPDEPDLETNSFFTTLRYGVANIPISLTDNLVDSKKYLDGKLDIFQPYVPLTPEVNAGEYQRACLWVLKQKEPIKVETESSKFDIRKFVETHQLKAEGAHVWRQQFDRSVNSVRDLYGLGRGRVFHRVRKAEPMK